METNDTKDKQQSHAGGKTVSVVMCTYNGERFLREQLDSIIAQTYPLLEIIIQDDGSTDATPAICRDYEARYPIVRFIQNEHNLGYNRNFQSVCEKVTGDFVALSDQDDVWFPQKIEKLVAAIGDCDIAFSPHTRGTEQKKAHVRDPQCALEALLFNGFAGHTCLFRRDFLQVTENWSLPLIYDWGLEIQAQLGRGIARVEEPLGWHRSNPQSACAEEIRKAGLKGPAHPTWQPYAYGLRNYRRLQRLPNWQMLYTYIYEHTSQTHQPLAHKMAGLMLSGSLWSLFRLCLLCWKHGDTIYFYKHQHGLMGAIRQFAYPLIFSYQNLSYEKK